MFLGLDGDKWNVLYSKNCPDHPNTVTIDGATAWTFNVKDNRQPHYILRGASDSVRNAIKDSGSSLVVTMAIAEEELKSVQDGGTDTYATVMLQRQGDDLSGQGKFEHYRQWAGSKRIALVSGLFEVTIPMDRTLWTGVFGKNAPDDAWKGVLANLAKIGVTLGGKSDFGHGIKGNGRITMRKFEVR
jgi:hypothetical protein